MNAILAEILLRFDCTISIDVTRLSSNHYVFGFVVQSEYHVLLPAKCAAFQILNLRALRFVSSQEYNKTLAPLLVYQNKQQ